ncbi:GNAT family N-acetyltransferase [Deefgea tanakiae]|uniref:GNAT family N-acetyltransferase n=1 Tax=Deefgea tanakiae TaxID=2865840 RepID=A0ABX8Z8Q1_9NEIS|nr:GNAT family N-acetyltransferase [Deefgea tanakiae]QZA78961.1 GNAT family N-acetyltransferase [Deefgea tanakiae]
MKSSTIRHQTTSDIQAILDIQAACYPADFIESAETLLCKQALAPNTSWLIETQGEVMGYLFCHPWRHDTPPQLGKKLTQLPAQPDRFYIHDLAILPAGRGKQLAEQLIEHAISWAKQAQLDRVMLVAVQGAESFWQKHHFAAKAFPRVEGYGDDAVCMHRVL